MLDITEQMPFEIPENWVWVRMGQIGELGGLVQHLRKG